MLYRKFAFGFFISSMLGVMGSAVPAAEVHKWVDSQGVTHYSESPPESGQTESEILRLPDQYPANQNSAQDYFSVINQAQRLQASRLAIEESRRKDQQLQLDQQALSSSLNTNAPPARRDITYYPAYPVSIPYWNYLYSPSQTHGDDFHRIDGRHTKSHGHRAHDSVSGPAFKASLFDR